MTGTRARWGVVLCAVVAVAIVIVIRFSPERRGEVMSVAY